MRIRREHVPTADNFTIVPNAWARDPNLSRRAVGMLVELLSHREGWDITVESLWRGGTEGRAAVTATLKELEAAGYLVRRQTREGHLFGSAEYVITDPATGSGGGLSGDGVSADVPSADVPSAHDKSVTKKNNQEDQPKNTKQVSSSATADSPPAGTGGKGRKPEPYREDVEALCVRLRDHIAVNTDKPPNITQRWRTQARLLLDRDRIPFDEAVRVLDWCQQDSFWMPNILSMPTFREKFAQLQIKSRQPQGGGRPNTLDAWATPAGEDMVEFGTQPTTAPMDYIDAEHFQEIQQ